MATPAESSPRPLTTQPELLACIEAMRAIRREFLNPADIVLEGAPVMHRLLARGVELLTEEQREGCDDHYARNLLHAEPDGEMSLFAIVWKPGQWTPVHDHGSWGLVAVLQGALHERNYIRTDAMARANSGVELRRGGTSVLSPGSVTTFVPNPDHIHRAGVPHDWGETVTLHLYGRNMDSYNVYDIELGRRVPVDVGVDNQY